MIFLSKEQDENQVTFTKKYNKEDSIVDIAVHNSVFIYNHFRAFINHPKTTFYDLYFQDNIRILDCIIIKENPIDSLHNTYKKYNSWIVGKVLNESKVRQVYLECAKNSYLKVNKIMLSNGKNINFSGYEFKDKLSSI
jgi:methionyl-tRNA formyltransferase